jgi:hypothetical protein
MNTQSKLASAALVGLLTASLMSTKIALASDHKDENGSVTEKSECKGVSGCKGEAKSKTEKSECKGVSGCKGEAKSKTEKSACNGHSEKE